MLLCAYIEPDPTLQHSFVASLMYARSVSGGEGPGKPQNLSTKHCFKRQSKGGRIYVHAH